MDETVKVYCSVDRDVESRDFQLFIPRRDQDLERQRRERSLFRTRVKDLADRSTFDSVGHNLLTRSQAIARI